MTTILHVTSHLGGGIGKVLSGLVIHSQINKHEIVCLEEPIKKEVINKILSNNGNVYIQPTIEKLKDLINKSDIIQLEYWSQPLRPEVIKFLKLLTKLQIPIRLVTWFHQNGFFDPLPEITKQLILNSTFLFTSECSFENRNIVNLINNNEYVKDRIGTVYSSGGFDDLPYPQDIQDNVNNPTEPTSIGYFGTINIEKEKMFSNFVDYISSIDIPNLKVKMIGDCNQNTKNVLLGQCQKHNKPDIMEFTGYIPNRKDLIKMLKTINVNIHLLNPNHYGTAENTLLETMAMGAVPVTLNNLPEKHLIQDYKNHKIGFITHSKEEFADIIKWLYENPDKRYKMGIKASKYVREKFSLERTISSLDKWYEKTMEREKEKVIIDI